MKKLAAYVALFIAMIVGGTIGGAAVDYMVSDSYGTKDFIKLFRTVVIIVCVFTLFDWGGKYWRGRRTEKN